MSGLELALQAVVSLFVLTDPITRGVFFGILTEQEPQHRRRYVHTIMLAVALTLGVAAVAGKPLLDLFGINLGAFGFAGGLVLSMMGFEMLLGGEPSGPQGGEQAHQVPAARSAQDSVVVPYAVPFMAGPGAIATVVTVASEGPGWTGVVAALVAVAVVVALVPVGHLWLAGRVRLSDQAMTLVTRFGGLVVLTIGVQLALSGIRTYFVP